MIYRSQAIAQERASMIRLVKPPHCSVCLQGLRSYYEIRTLINVIRLSKLKRNFYHAFSANTSSYVRLLPTARVSELMLQKEGNN